MLLLLLFFLFRLYTIFFFLLLRWCDATNRNSCDIPVMCLTQNTDFSPSHRCKCEGELSNVKPASMKHMRPWSNSWIIVEYIDSVLLMVNHSWFCARVDARCKLCYHCYLAVCMWKHVNNNVWQQDKDQRLYTAISVLLKTSALESGGNKTYTCSLLMLRDVTVGCKFEWQLLKKHSPLQTQVTYSVYLANSHRPQISSVI